MEGWRFLLLRAFNHWDFPKGMVEPGEQPLAAAIREVKEETLICDLDFAWGEVYTQTGPYSRGKIARYYLARTDTSAVTLTVIEELGRAEHNEFRWVDEAAALRLVSPRVEPIVQWAAARLMEATPGKRSAGASAGGSELEGATDGRPRE
jgi:8-oxo-dGTP pyrophosphatase MutT (NUDIX family)